MEICFVHDHCFMLCDGAMYSPGRITSYTWKRFDGVFEKIVVLARYKNVDRTEGLERSFSDNVTFDCFEQGLGGALALAFSSQARSRLCVAIKHADLVVARLPSFIGGTAVKIAKELRKPYAVEVVGDPRESLRTTGRFGWLFAGWMGRHMAKQVRSAIGALYVTNSLLQTKYPCSGLTGVASNVDITLPSQNRYCGVHSQSPLRIGVIGSYEQRYKGIAIAIAAINELFATKNQRIIFECVGGPLADDLRQAGFSVGEGIQIRSKGILSKVHLIEWLDSLDIYIQPSFTEGLPRGLIEAMSRGIPSVASSVGGIPELLPLEWRFSAGNVTELAFLLKRLTDVSTRMKLSAFCFNVAREYDRERLEESRKRFYSSVRDKLLG